MRSIKQKLIIFVGVLFAIVCCCLSVTSYYNASSVLQDSTHSSISEVAKQTSDTISSMIDGNIKQLESIAARSDIKDPNVTKEEKIKILYEEAQRIGCERLTIIDQNGDSFNGNGKEQNLGDREYFTKAMAGESNVTDPSIGKSTGQLLVFYAVPIKDGDKVIGVLQEVQDGNNLSELTNQVKYGENGYAYMVGSDGTLIAHQDNERVMNCENIIADAEADSSYTEYAEAVKKAAEDKNGFTSYSLNGVENYVGFAQVEGTEWEVMVEIGKGEILSGLNTLKMTTLFSSILFLVIGVAATYMIAHRISKGIKTSSKTLDQLASGDLRVNASHAYLNQKDEVGEMTRAMQTMSNALSDAIKKIKDNSSEIDHQSESLSLTSDEISSVSQNVAEAIGEIARGTVTQSEDLTKISDTLNEFADMVLQIGNEIQDVAQTSGEINKQAVGSSEEMAELNTSVAKVGTAFQTFRNKIDDLGNNVSEINQITNVINEIAEQTNLLALNAAIEAARAGEAGKGFAVVAEEIRGLAEQSQESSEKITQLVVGISQETNNIVKESAVMDSELTQQGEVIKNSIESFNSIITSIDEILPKINTVEKSAENLNEKKTDILSRVENISSVALEVSASAEEISAASEEMNASITEMAGIADDLKVRTKVMQDGVDTFTVE